jgi:hypothetical protein
MSGVYRKRVRVRGAQVSVTNLKSLSRQVTGAGLGGTAGADLAMRLKEAGEIIAALARANFGSWSSRIPGSVRVTGGRTGVNVVAGGKKGPAAYTAELHVRHPLFGNRDYWYDPGADQKPGLAPAAEEGVDAAARVVAEVIDDWAHEYGFR